MPWEETTSVEQRHDFRPARAGEGAHDRGPVQGLRNQPGHRLQVDQALQAGKGRPGGIAQNASVQPKFVQLILECRKRWSWGAKKIGPRLQEEHPELEIPGTSTISGILERHGLTQPVE